MRMCRQGIQFKRIFIFMLVLLVLTVNIVGCGTSDKDGKESSDISSETPGKSTADDSKKDEGDKADDNGLSEPGELPIVTEPVTLTIGIQQHPLTTDYEDNYFTNLVEDVTGVNLDFELFPSEGEEAKQKFTLMTSANQALPDILCLGFSDIERATYGSSGVFIPLNDYFENDAYFFNETLGKWASAEEKENVIKYGTSPDGNIYGYPTYSIDPGDSSALGCWINNQWLDNLGMDIPTTTEELYDVLKAFKESDANDNGNASDEIPLIGHKEWMGNVDLYLMNSFIYDAFAGTWGYQLNAENGKLYAPFVTDEWREGIRYIHKLAEEELLSPLSFSQTQNELRAILSDSDDKDSIIGAFVGHPSPLFGTDGVERVKEYTPMPAMAGPDGVNWTPNSGWFASYGTQITSSCENPDLAFRVMDAISKEDISISHRYGEEGVDWIYTDQGEPNHVLEGYEAIYKQTYTSDRPARWQSENDTIWHSTPMAQLPPKLHGGLVRSDYPNEYREYQMRDLWYESVPLRYDNYPDELVARLIFTQEEVDAISEIQTSIYSYVDESRTRFILGDMNIETDWDSYISTLESMGLGELIEVSQTCYERMMSQ